MMKLSQGLSLVLLIGLNVGTFVILLWAVRSLSKSDGSLNQRSTQLGLSILLPSIFFAVYQFRGFVRLTYVSGVIAGLLVVIGCLAGLMVCLSGIKLALLARKQAEPAAGLVAGAILSGFIAPASVILMLR